MSTSLEHPNKIRSPLSLHTHDAFHFICTAWVAGSRRVSVVFFGYTEDPMRVIHKNSNALHSLLMKNPRYRQIQIDRLAFVTANAQARRQNLPCNRHLANTHTFDANRQKIPLVQSFHYCHRHRCCCCCYPLSAWETQSALIDGSSKGYDHFDSQNSLVAQPKTDSTNKFDSSPLQLFPIHHVHVLV